MLNIGSDWISPRYVESLERDRLAPYVSTAPFRHAVFPDFFRPEVIDAIAERARAIEIHPGRADLVAAGSTRRARVKWGPFLDRNTLKFMVSPAFRAFMTTALGEEFRLKPSAIPQLAEFAPSSGGFDLHNDADEPRNGVAILNLTDAHPADGGGELYIHDGSGAIVRKIRPVRNTLTLFTVSRASWHSVADMNGEWTRRNVLFDWDRAVNAGAVASHA